MKKGKYGYLVKNTLLFSLSSFGSKFISFILMPLYTSILSTDDYGVADVISTAAYLLIYIFTLNISDSVLRFAIDKKDRQGEIFGIGLRYLFIGTVIVGTIDALVFSLHIFDWEGYCYLFIFISFIVQAMYSTISNYLRACDKIKSVSIAGILLTFITVLSNIICLSFLKLGLIGYLISINFGYIVAIVFCFLRIKPLGKIAIWKKPADNIEKQMLAYSIPLVFNGIAWWMNTSMDRFFLVGLCGMAAEGIYATANKIPSILTVVHTVFSQAWNLSAIKEYDKEDTDGFFSNTYEIYNMILTLACSGLILFTKMIARIMYIGEFFDAWKYTGVLIIAIVFSALSSFLGSVFAAVKNSKIFASSTIIAAIINVIMNAILIRMYGIQGATIATAISFFCIWIIRMQCVRKYIKLRIKILRDVVSYVLLIIQVFVEHMETYSGIIQFAILLIIAVMYMDQAKRIFMSLKRRIGNESKKDND